MLVQVLLSADHTLRFCWGRSRTVRNFCLSLILAVPLSWSGMKWSNECADTQKNIGRSRASWNHTILLPPVGVWLELLPILIPRSKKLNGVSGSCGNKQPRFIKLISESPFKYCDLVSLSLNNSKKWCCLSRGYLKIPETKCGNASPTERWTIMNDKNTKGIETGKSARKVVLSKPHHRRVSNTALGYFIKMGRFNRKRQRFRGDSVSHGNTSADI
jgi:hypothetical protein